MSVVQRPLRVLASLVLSACVPGLKVSAAEADAGSLADLSLEELSNVQITSVSKRAERLSDAAASVFVITADDIRRSGVRSLPEALRLAPNLEVAQASASGYAISARGFNGVGSPANKLLVLIDGRSVYTPLFAGVFWDDQDVMLEDVERIEVISGPGGTLWGVNAVNGVINVITRSAANTQGGLVPAGIGNREASAAFRYGGKVGADGAYRVYGMYFDRHHTTAEDGTTQDDAWHKSQAGFRMDWSHAGDSLTLNGNGYVASEGQPSPGSVSITGVTLPLGQVSLSGANLTGRWSRTLEAGSSLSVQAYFDRTQRDNPPTFSESLDIYDLQLQHSLRPFGIHSVVWGGEFRYGMNRVTNASFLVSSIMGLVPGPPRPVFGFLPRDVNQRWPSLFAQDEVMLGQDLRLTVGARLERNDYTGTEFLPSIRLAWKVGPQHLIWTAASRAVRAPSRFDRDTYVPGAPPFLLAGGPDARSEIANVYELGYRGQPTGSLSYSVTVFHADYDHLHAQQIAPSGTFLLFSNQMQGNSTGIETWGTYQAAATWRLSAGLNALRERLTVRPGSVDIGGVIAQQAIAQQGRDPTHTWTARSSFDLPYRTELDVMARRVSSLSDPAGPVPAYTAVDVRAGWKPWRELELSVTGRNLFSGGHPEITNTNTQTRFGQDVFFKAACRF
ncbi:MAG TPA: TonB-dependent receptor [Burkholderiaceae bacterium]|nr:TonB-dependent receptor [Burkholderiaceae bacterium]